MLSVETAANHVLLTWYDGPWPDTSENRIVFSAGPFASPGEARESRQTLRSLLVAYPPEIRVEPFFGSETRLYLDVGGVALQDYALSNETRVKTDLAACAILATGELSEGYDPSKTPDFLALTEREATLYLGDVALLPKRSPTVVRAFREGLRESLWSRRVTLGVAKGHYAYILRAQSVGGIYPLQGLYETLPAAVCAGASLLVHADVWRVQETRYHRDPVGP